MALIHRKYFFMDPFFKARLPFDNPIHSQQYENLGIDIKYQCRPGTRVSQCSDLIIVYTAAEVLSLRDRITKADKCHFLELNNRTDFSSICF